MAADEGLLEVGKIGRAHGVRGDLYVDLLTDRTERVAAGARLQAKGQWLTVQTASRPAGTRWLVHFEGMADRTAAEAWVGTPCSLRRCRPATMGWYVHDLIGAQVVGVDGTEYGPCVAVVANPAHDLLELEDGSLVPVVFLTDVDRGARHDRSAGRPCSTCWGELVATFSVCRTEVRSKRSARNSSRWARPASLRERMVTLRGR
jgi:16S rRNA processing protein RimM